jgi:hypothetical protein
VVVADEQDVADHDRVVPGLAFERRGPRHFRELIRSRLYQRQLAFLG